LLFVLALSVAGCQGQSQTAAVFDQVAAESAGVPNPKSKIENPKSDPAPGKTRQQMVDDANASGDRRADKVAFNDVRRYGQHFAEEHWVGAWKQAFEPEDLLVYSLFAGAALAVRPSDRTIARHIQDERPLADFGHWDTALAVGVPALTMLGLYLFPPPGGPELKYDHMAAFSEALLIDSAATMGLKGLVHRRRPDGDDHQSFPSFHVSIIFTTGAYVNEAYGLTEAAPIYVLGTITALARMNDGDHFASDVIAGAGVGWLVGELVYKWHFGKGGVVDRIKWRILPYADGESAGVLFMRSF
jgi:membrane-associated phospholipid phosphatase